MQTEGCRLFVQVGFIVRPLSQLQTRILKLLQDMVSCLILIGHEQQKTRSSA